MVIFPSIGFTRKYSTFYGYIHSSITRTWFTQHSGQHTSIGCCYVESFARPALFKNRWPRYLGRHRCFAFSVLLAPPFTETTAPLSAKPSMHTHETHLLEPNSLGLLPESLARHVEAVLADHTGLFLVAGDAAAF